MDIRDNIAQGKYTSVIGTSLDYEEIKIDTSNMTGRQVKEAREKNLESRRAARRLHNHEQQRLDSAFRDDLEIHFNVKGHPKCDILWRMAWDRGHSSGYEEVLNEYEDLMELIR